MPQYPPINAIGTTPVVLRLPSSPKENQFIENSGTVTVYLGGASVTTSTGLPFPPASRVQLTENGGGLYAVAAAGATGTVTIGVGLNQSMRSR